MRVRIALTKDDKRYLVQQLDIRAGIVHCWGEVLGYETVTGKTTHGASKKFPLYDVVIVEVDKKECAPALFEQTRDAEVSR